MNDPTSAPKSDPKSKDWIREKIVISSVTALIAVLGLYIFGSVAWTVFTSGGYFITLTQQYPILVLGLLIAIPCAFLVVYLYRSSDEKVSLKMPGFDITGPSCEVILWCVTFITICVSMRLLK